ncbi:hypothetical protein L596_024188 [Steinernema carpocapsae]|uniref:Uncharacterized protein n=1 Tax=Steinernema carpocapsae TaxID=34508 RepID=A0A4U5MG96_STECR|nr:hypothetical protein L596_024188 [Steinernema carpocapsae]
MLKRSPWSCCERRLRLLLHLHPARNHLDYSRHLHEMQNNHSYSTPCGRSGTTPARSSRPGWVTVFGRAGG